MLVFVAYLITTFWRNTFCKCRLVLVLPVILLVAALCVASGRPIFPSAALVAEAAPVAPSDMLYFFNAPETVRKEGSVGRVLVPAHTPRVRAFFHFVNRTGDERSFHMSLPHGSRVLRTGVAHAHDPLLAGARAASCFLTPVKDDDASRLRFRLRTGITVSGIVEFIPPVDGGYLSAHMGTGALVPGVRVDHVAGIQVRAGTVALDGSKLRLADKPVQGRIAGEYGASLIVRSAAAGRFQVNPRGGALRFVALSRKTGRVVCTDSLAVRKWHTVAKTDVGEEWEIVPVGGAFYPMEVRLVK